MASIDDRVQYGPLKKLEVKNCVAYSGITCILGFLLFAFILMLIPGDAPEPPVLYGVISGVVLGPDNLPVENIEVLCPSFETVTTNANGEFSFPEAVYGEYVLTINAPNYEQETVNVVLDSSNVDVEISLTFLYGVISGVVLGPDNLPVENIEVTCPSFETVTTNANGEFSFPEAVYGEYVLTINAPNYEPETVNVVVDSASVNAEFSLTFSPAEVIIKVFRISTSEPMAGVGLMLNCNGQMFGSTDEMGSFTFNDLPRVSCYLLVTKTGFFSEERSISLNSYTRTVSVNLRASAWLHVYTKDQSNNPINGVSVTVEGPDYYYGWGTTSGDGRIVFDSLAEGHYYRISTSMTGYHHQTLEPKLIAGQNTVNFILIPQ
ncbi:hypothetical protein RCL1_006651 [Eukaryota sp. TZLM3-RCL]